MHSYATLYRLGTRARAAERAAQEARRRAWLASRSEAPERNRDWVRAEHAYEVACRDYDVEHARVYPGM